ncbi:armadillo-type protein [Pyronema domesticum]|uniref:Similar to Importin subunit beta-2 acc. no. O14089 n=1 Tax=Pyronema omphalodes (strain CBS 100304) TaxID=1076935 RepID=U4LGE2_PYROM|nr:armadillo-type protein [Pyronema domesticum]CCX15054.1 Similar to Importin subunit beta-2; acc. no. O14089 [Pyronema omphalodes CBS 100304]
MAWQPQEAPMRELAGYLQDSLGSDRAAQLRATQMLQQASQQSPDINNYLCYILVHAEPPPGMKESEYHLVRCSAAMLMKNNIGLIPSSLSPQTLTYIKSELINGLKDPNQGIRNFTGNVITELLRKGGIMAWADVLTQLISMVEGKDSNGVELPIPVQEGAMSALKKVCQDSKKALEKDPQQPLNFMIPKFLQFTHHSSTQVQAETLEIVNIFLQLRTQAVLANIDLMVESLFRLGNSPYAPLRREVCRALVHLVDIRPDKIAPIMGGVVDYVVAQQNDPDADVALDAAEFWLTVGEHDQLRGTLGPFLPKIVPILMKSMIYSEEEIFRLGGEGDDADEEDKEEDIKPTFAKSRQRLPNGESVEVMDNDKLPNGDDLSDGEIDEYDSDLDDVYGMEDPEDRWNLRKCSAAALDVLATVFHQPVLEVILPYLKENLRHPEWPYREAAVLALGAVADGCLDGVAPHLPELVPYLISLLNDEEPLVRQITCWTLGRYSRWAATDPNPANPDPTHLQRYFEPTMEGILMKMLDGNKRVQEAAASAFANLEEQSKQVLEPYIKVIIQQFVTAMRQYKDRNMFILYDCVQTLAEHVSEALAQDDLVAILMPALIERWKKVKDDSRELFPLLECLSYVSTALGAKFQPFASPIFHRCISIIHQNLEKQMAFNQNPALDEPEKDFLVTSLDLLSALIQALDSQSGQLVAEARPGFFELLTHCMADFNNDVRQSSYALLGDCAIYVFPQLQPYLPGVMDLLIRQLDIEQLSENDDDNSFAVINNACWSCGEIALQQAAGMLPYVEKLYISLLNIIQSNKVPGSVTENAAVALGRLGLGSCDELAPYLETFAYPFLDALSKVAETDEKDTALKGFCMVVGRNPEAMESCLVPFFRCIAKYKVPSDELRHLFKQTVAGYRNFISDFDGFLSQIPAVDRETIQTAYA